MMSYAYIRTAEIKSHLANLVRLAAVRARITASGLGNADNPGLYPDADNAITKSTNAIRRAIRDAEADRYARNRLFVAVDSILESAAARERYRILAEAAALVGDEDGRIHLDLSDEHVPAWLRDVVESGENTRAVIIHEINSHTGIIDAEADRILQAVSDHYAKNGTTS